MWVLACHLIYLRRDVIPSSIAKYEREMWTEKCFWIHALYMRPRNGILITRVWGWHLRMGLHVETTRIDPAICDEMADHLRKAYNAGYWMPISNNIFLFFFTLYHIYRKLFSGNVTLSISWILRVVMIILKLSFFCTIL